MGPSCSRRLAQTVFVVPALPAPAWLLLPCLVRSGPSSCPNRRHGTISQTSPASALLRLLHASRPPQDARCNCFQWLFSPYSRRWHLRPPGHEAGRCIAQQVCERRNFSADSYVGSAFVSFGLSQPVDTSVRDKDVFIVQSGSPKINDAVMELLIMVSACKGGSSKSITGIVAFLRAHQCS